MMKRNKKSSTGICGSTTPAVKRGRSGYTLSELRYQRALTLVKMDMTADKLYGYAQQFSPSAVSSNFFMRMVSNGNIAEYASMALRVGKTVYRLWRKFKK